MLFYIWVWWCIHVYVHILTLCCLCLSSIILHMCVYTQGSTQNGLHEKCKVSAMNFHVGWLFSRIKNFKDFSDVHRSSIISILKIVLSNIVTAYHSKIYPLFKIIFLKSSKLYILEKSSLLWSAYSYRKNSLFRKVATHKIPTLKWCTVYMR